eukprot:5670666-Alexandrium_andersonii.AAC.1
MSKALAVQDLGLERAGASKRWTLDELLDDALLVLRIEHEGGPVRKVGLADLAVAPRQGSATAAKPV